MQHFPIKFQSASTMMGLNSRIARLDNMLGFIQKGKVLFIKGTQSRKHILELFCLRSIVQYQNYCIFVDGGNSFDPYLISKLATISKENPREILSRIIISRAFTCHQLASLIEETEQIIDTFPTNFIAIADILHLFTDPEADVDNYEIEMIVPKMLKCIRDLTRSDAIAMVTSDTKNEWLNRMVESYSDIVLTVRNDKELVNIELNKHPSRQNTSIEFNKNELILQNKPDIKHETIEPWLIANG
ncbi:MAG: hypothetical protein HMLIMOIP_000229 [Candidatus Nitrosomirales archaeon]|jgi:hypothetical protein